MFCAYPDDIWVVSYTIEHPLPEWFHALTRSVDVSAGAVYNDDADESKPPFACRVLTIGRHLGKVERALRTGYPYRLEMYAITFRQMTELYQRFLH
jgi:hypothetical protein